MLWCIYVLEHLTCALLRDFSFFFFLYFLFKCTGNVQEWVERGRRAKKPVWQEFSKAQKSFFFLLPSFFLLHFFFSQQSRESPRTKNSCATREGERETHSLTEFQSRSSALRSSQLNKHFKLLAFSFLRVSFERKRGKVLRAMRRLWNFFNSHKKKSKQQNFQFFFVFDWNFTKT